MIDKASHRPHLLRIVVVEDEAGIRAELAGGCAAPLPGEPAGLDLKAAARRAAREVERVLIRRIKDTSAARLHPFVLEAVDPESVVHTDGWEGYTALAQRGYRLQVTVGKHAASELMPRVHGRRPHPLRADGQALPGAQGQGSQDVVVT